MNTRRLFGFLVASLGTYLFAALPANALTICDPTLGCGPTSDTLEVVDANGNILKDVNGNPTALTITEGSPAETVTLSGGSSFQLSVPDVLSSADVLSRVSMIETPINAITQQAVESDFVIVEIIRNQPSGPPGSQVFVTFASDAEASANPIMVDCGILSSHCVFETGQLTDFTGTLFPGVSLSFRILAESDPAEVPEPETLVLLGSGLAGLAAMGARRPRVQSSVRATCLD